MSWTQQSLSHFSSYFQILCSESTARERCILLLMQNPVLLRLFIYFFTLLLKEQKGRQFHSLVKVLFIKFIFFFKKEKKEIRE